jgi:hypothetical protein
MRAQTSLVVCASGEYTFVHSVAVPNDRLSPIDQKDLTDPLTDILLIVRHWNGRTNTAPLDRLALEFIFASKTFTIPPRRRAS